MNIDELAEIRNAKPVAFEKYIKICPKCGWGPSHLPALLVRWFDLAHCGFRVSYCRGGQDVEKTVTHATLGGLIEQTINPVCAGIACDHLHVMCTHCCFLFLMESRDAR